MRGEEQEPSAVLVTINKTAAPKKSITVVEESESHTEVHNHGIKNHVANWPCCGASGAVAARHLMHLSMAGCSSHREIPSAAYS